MTLRWLATGILAAALFTGCKSASPRWPATRAASPAQAPDPNRWERAACRQGEYPVDLDGRAFARAKFEDLQARKAGSAGRFATARLERERAAFEARCATWRIAALGDGI